MTCVVAVIEGQSMAMVGDSSAGNQDMLNNTLSYPPKVAQDGCLLFGYAGDFRMFQLAEEARLRTVRSGSEMAKRLTRARLRFGWSELKGPEGELLVCRKGQIHYFNGDGTWLEIAPTKRAKLPPLTYAAIGSGAGVALGALYALAQEKMPLVKRARVALEAAVCHHLFVRAPLFTVEM